MSGNVRVGYPNYFDIAVLDGAAGWTAGMPLAFLQTEHMSLPGRTVDADEANTRFRAEYPEALAMDVFGFIRHNMSVDASMQILFGTSAGGSQVLDSTDLPVWTMTRKPWEIKRWLPGQPEPIFLRTPYGFFFVSPTEITFNHMDVQIRDEDNPDGYIQMARVFTGPSFQSVRQAKEGNPVKWNPLSRTNYAEDGAPFHTERGSGYRSAESFFPAISESEGNHVFSIQEHASTTKECLYLPYPENAALNQRYGFLANHDQMSPIEAILGDKNSTGFKFREIK